MVKWLIFKSQEKLNFCEGCVFGKQHKEPFPTSRVSRASKLLGLVHFDVWGPTQIPSFGGAKYFLTFIDDFSKKTFCYFLKNKSEYFIKFQEFKAFIESQIKNKIKVLRSDNGSEFT
jgi:transposase InsO family protein